MDERINSNFHIGSDCSYHPLKNYIHFIPDQSNPVRLLSLARVLTYVSWECAFCFSAWWYVSYSGSGGTIRISAYSHNMTMSLAPMPSRDGLPRGLIQQPLLHIHGSLCILATTTRTASRPPFFPYPIPAYTSALLTKLEDEHNL